MLELVCEIQEYLQVLVLLIGEECLLEKFRKVEWVYNWVLEWVLVEKCDFDDICVFVDLFCFELILSDDLIVQVLNKFGGWVCCIVVNFNKIKEIVWNEWVDWFFVDLFVDDWFYIGMLCGWIKERVV